MSKYNDLMNKVEVSADMKSRILLNLEKELAAEKEDEEVVSDDAKEMEASVEETVEDSSYTSVAEEKTASATAQNTSTEADFKELARRKRIAAFRRFGALAATFAILLVGAATVMRMTGGNKMASSSPSYDSAVMESASEAPAAAQEAMATESAAEPMEMAEMEVSEDIAMDAAAEAPAVEYAAEESMQAKTEGASSLMNAMEDDAMLADAETEAETQAEEADAEAEDHVVKQPAAAAPVAPAPESIAEPKDGTYTDMTGVAPENAGFAKTISLIIAIVVLAGIVIALIYVAYQSIRKK